MIQLLKDYLGAFLWDEATAQRVIASLWFLVGMIFSAGGVVPLPGTQVTIPLGSWGPHLQPVGELMKFLAVYMAAGGKLPVPKDSALAPPKS